ncbi:hypothetical protein BV898_13863 [Hypsibius exemplaris]|uniref:Uncharacterized protein n=1 Tax=Hypsibius exemplaris TaxID=2072580 RepID=A0A1W0W9B7_HYPEX|nr:hypothetical protein BV898_13863 [Hypsibius exemplaris]
MGIVHGCNYGRGGSKNWVYPWATHLDHCLQHRGGRAVGDFMLAQTIRFQDVVSPGRLIADCTVYQAELWIYKLRHSVLRGQEQDHRHGLIMGAVACFEAIFALAGAIIVRKPITNSSDAADSSSSSSLSSLSSSSKFMLHTGENRIKTNFLPASSKNVGGRSLSHFGHGMVGV